MYSKLDIVEYLKIAPGSLVLDVRSPSEYDKGHIIGAQSVPLFTDVERAEVGTVYKQQSRQKAILRGLEITGPKLAGYVRQVEQLAAPGQELLLYCWRGGMRSGSMAWLFATAGWTAATLQGGYKAWRRYIRSLMATPAQLIVLGGMTGSGKTEILHELARQGEQVLDLEGLAHHKGSAFGHIGQPRQPPNEHFANLVGEHWRKMDLNRRIWLEDESYSIGRVTIPDGLFAQMRQAPVITLEMDKALRISRLVQDYGACPDKELIAALQRIGKRLGGQSLKKAIEAISNKDYDYVADLALNYYDKTYSYGLAKREAHTLVPFRVEDADVGQTAQALRQFADKRSWK